MDLPDGVIVAMLKREVLLTRAKLHGLMYDHIMSERRLRSLKTQLRQVSFEQKYFVQVRSVRLRALRR